MKHRTIPNLELTIAQKRVALKRMLKKTPQAQSGENPPLGMPMPAGQPMGQPMGMEGMEGMEMGMGMGGMPGMPGMETDPMGDPMGGPEISSENLQGPEEPEMLSDVEELASYALVADQLWKDGGGSGSLGARIWEEYQTDSDPSSLDSPRDYFINCYIRWKDSPEEFRRKHPREARLIRQLDTEFEASIEGQI